MFALCANNKLFRVSNIIILSLGRVQEDNPSAFFGSEILSARIAELHQRIINAKLILAGLMPSQLYASNVRFVPIADMIEQAAWLLFRNLPASHKTVPRSRL